MSFLNLENKNILVMGVANKKSVAWHIAKILKKKVRTFFTAYVLRIEKNLSIN